MGISVVCSASPLTPVLSTGDEELRDLYLSGQVFADFHRDADTGPGVDEYGRAAEIAAELSSRLGSYEAPAMPAAQRRFLMRELGQRMPGVELPVPRQMSAT